MGLLNHNIHAMYAIVEMAGQQFKVAKDQKVYVHRLQTEEGKKVTFDNVLLLDDGKNITIGAPAINGAAVEAKVVKHLKGDKVIVFQEKTKKGLPKEKWSPTGVDRNRGGEHYRLRSQKRSCGKGRETESRSC